MDERVKDGGKHPIGVLATHSVYLLEITISLWFLETHLSNCSGRNSPTLYTPYQAMRLPTNDLN